MHRPGTRPGGTTSTRMSTETSIKTKRRRSQAQLRDGVPLTMTLPTGSNRSMADISPGGLPSLSLFDCCVQFRPDENDHDRKPDPGHETDDGAQGPINSIVTVEFRDIPSEEHGHRDQQDGGKRTAQRHPAPPCIAVNRPGFAGGCFV